MAKKRPVFDLLEQTMLAGVGLLFLTHDKISELVDKLVEEGKIKPEQARELARELADRGEQEREELQRLVREEIDRLTPATKEDLQALERKIDELATRLDKLAASPSPQESGEASSKTE